MPKKRGQRTHTPAPLIKRAKRKGTIIIILILSVAITSIILAQWKSSRVTGRTNAMLTAPLPQASPTPQISKEYVYAGSKLLATEEPTPTVTPTPPSADYRSLSLNGTTSYATVPNSSGIDIYGAITVEAWVKATSTTGSYQDILCRINWGQAGTGGGYELSITNTGKLRLDLYQGPTTYTTVIGTTVVSAGVWHHVAGVFDGSQMRVYLDGQLDGSLSTTSGPASGTSFIEIGNTTYTGASYRFGGLIDEIRLSSAALYASNFTPEYHLSATSGTTRALWKFDGEVVTDFSGNSNHATAYPSATYSTDVPEAPQRSLSLNGTDAYVLIPNSTSIDVYGAITLEVWVKYTPNNYYQDIVTRESWGQTGTGGGFELSINPAGKARLDFYQSPTTATTATGTTTISSGQWQHIAGVYDGSQIRLYVNGQLDAAVTAAGPAAGTSPIRIGRNSTGASYFFNGLIDEVRLSATALYSNNFTPDRKLGAVTGTRGVWKFNDQTAHDSSSNGNDGTAQGGATYSTDVP